MPPNSVTSYSYTERRLPWYTANWTALYQGPNYYSRTPQSNMIFLFWDDLYYYNGSPQGIFYQVDGIAPTRNLTFEYYASHFQGQDQYYRE